MRGRDVIRRGALRLVLAGGALGAALLPGAAQAYWVRGVWVERPVVVAPPPAVVVAPGVVGVPVVPYYPRRRFWVPAHWRGPYLVPGHWGWR